jgi:hypothetical protein
LEWSWNFIAFISFIIGIMAIVTASELDNDLKGFGFGAIWTMFLILFLMFLGQYVLGGAARGCAGSKVSEYATPLLTGFWLGTTFMLAVAFFILGCVYAAFDDDAVKTLGAFYIVSCPLANFPMFYFQCFISNVVEPLNPQKITYNQYYNFHINRCSSSSSLLSVFTHW